MDDYRRRPTMEGFSRPGSLGGELTDEDSVEGHIVNDNKDQDQDTEGHANFKGALKAEDDEDTEGHANFKGALKAEDDEDTEGHANLR